MVLSYQATSTYCKKVLYSSNIVPCSDKYRRHASGQHADRSPEALHSERSEAYCCCARGASGASVRGWVSLDFAVED